MSYIYDFRLTFIYRTITFELTSVIKACAMPTQSKKPSKTGSLGTSTPLKGFAFSCVACCTAECITCPIDVVKTRLQISGELGTKKVYGGVFDAVKQMSCQEGVRALWKGLSPALIRQ